ncbi:zinc-binding dehydrogenase [Streptomyces profundus]|uniref:zinc-binding dehydrogenase n=1 Tax=Streptomyces profundus TaxID=2867410 RepID=UPI001D162BBD|nr:zinc-binding dehydrogenase [Streptomyces sp. MA3_2.13]UED84784.1 zinc-binding dehydrogenase [Streptomyces sp. MA3_2.13]
MHAIRLHAFGPPENLVHERVDDPVPAPGQVRIAVAAAGVHLVDTALRSGVPLGGHWKPTPLPTVPGREVAGTVDALGDGVDPAWLGRRVSAHLGMVPGGYAELAVTAVEKLHPLPDDLPETHAVALLGTGRMTMGILRFAAIQPGDTVLVLAAAGGIGALLTQVARHRGATVIGAAGGPAKVETVRGLGADLAVDYDRADWADTVRGAFGDRPVRYVFEGVGGERALAAIRLLAPGGAHLAYGTASQGIGDAESATLPKEELAERGITSEVVLGPALFERIGGMENLGVLEEEALDLAREGVAVPLTQTFPLAEAAAAHRALESRATVGKVVLVP